MMVASLVVPFIHLNTEHPTIVNNQLYKVEKTFQAQYPNEPVIFTSSLLIAWFGEGVVSTVVVGQNEWLNFSILVIFS